jgi:hypothetical protein
MIKCVIPTIGLASKELRSNVIENYQQTESDLIIAPPNLPTPGMENEGPISASFAKAILADLYLTWAGWPFKNATQFPLVTSKAKEIIN